MSIPLLATKLYIPQPSLNLVLRPHLIEQLNEGLKHKFTLITAPAGFGKTTLVAEWINSLVGSKQAEDGRKPKIESEAFPTKFAWLSLDEADNDLQRFLSYFIAALQQIEPQLGRAIQDLLQAPQAPPPEALMTPLINEISHAAPFALLLDDYHLIEAKPIHEALTFLLEHQPPQMHLVMTTRVDPPLPLSRLRGRGQLTELRASELRFTTEETALFLNQVMDLKLSAEDVAALEIRTEGWIAGLQLAALSMKGRSDLTGFVRAFTGSHRYILSYLIDEVLQRQPALVEHFLTSTSILERLSAPLCNAVTGRTDSQVILEQVAAANLFLIPLDDEGHWYRYHHLFAEMLQHRLQQSPPPDQEERGGIAELHYRAGCWYETNGFIDEAMSHLLTAGKVEQVADLVEKFARAKLKQGEASALLRWLGPFTEEQLCRRPRLCLAGAAVHIITNNPDGAQTYLNMAEKRLEGEAGSALSGIDSLRAEVLAYQAILLKISPHNLRKAITACHQALALAPEDDYYLRGLIAVVLGDAYRENQELERAIQAFTEGKVFNQKAGNTYLTLMSLGRLAGIYEVTGQLQHSYETCQQALKLATGPNGQPTVAAAAAYLGLGKILRERNQLELSIQVLEKAVDLSKLAGTNGITVDASITLALALQGQRHWTAAHQWLDRAEEIMQGWYYAPAMLVRLGAFRARLWLAQAWAQEAIREENVSAASRWARQNNLELPQEIGESLEIEYLTVARLYLAQGRWSEATGLLTSLLQGAKSESRLSRVIEILGLQALALSMQGPAYKEQALAGFSQALDLAEPEGYVRIFADEGLPMRSLLRQAVSQGLTLNYTNKLLAAFPDSGSDMSPIKSPEGNLLARNRESQTLVEPLSQREMELLRLVAAGLTNQEIAQELILAVGTVKKHLNNIFGKLGASNRTQAIARARELQLL